MAEPRRCQGTTNAGEPCPVPARYRRKWCYQHDPDPKVVQHRALARLQGGLNATHQQLLPVKQRRFDTVEALEALVDETICLVAARALKPAIANSIFKGVEMRTVLASRRASAELLAKLRGTAPAKRLALHTGEAAPPVDIRWAGYQERPAGMPAPRERSRAAVPTP